MTYDDLWQAITQSKRLYDATHDPLVKSGIKLLTSAMQREDPDRPDDDIELTEAESYAVANLTACKEAYETLYMASP
jgi:hypothetical protein